MLLYMYIDLKHNVGIILTHEGLQNVRQSLDVETLTV